MIFIPAAISLAGAGIIWKFVYAGPPFEDGLANQVAKAIPGLPASLGGEGDKIWLVDRNVGGLNPPASAPGLNTFLLVVIFIWAAAGLATVFFSAAIKGVPDALIDAARVDGATKRQVFYKVTLPYISATVVAVATITAIGALKAFDIVAATTGGNFGTSTIANEFYRVYFIQGRLGFGSAYSAVLLFLLRDPGRGHEPAGPTAGGGAVMSTTDPTVVTRTGRGAAHPCDRGAAGRDDRRCGDGRRRADGAVGERLALEPRRALHRARPRAPVDDPDVRPARLLGASRGRGQDVGVVGSLHPAQVHARQLRRRARRRRRAAPTSATSSSTR